MNEVDMEAGGKERLDLQSEIMSDGEETERERSQYGHGGRMYGEGGCGGVGGGGGVKVI